MILQGKFTFCLIFNFHQISYAIHQFKLYTVGCFHVCVLALVLSKQWVSSILIIFLFPSLHGSLYCILYIPLAFIHHFSA